MKLGIFGGTFNPIHQAHLMIAETMRANLKLDRVVFIPAPRPPHKTDEVILSFEHRYAMIELAIQGNERFEVSDIENQRSGPSYTSKTLALLKELHPTDEWYMIIGADSLLQLQTWFEPDQLIRLCAFAIFPRRNYDPRRAEARFLDNSILVDVPMIDYSSSWVRSQIRAGESIRYYVPDAVCEYIDRHQLYKETS